MTASIALFRRARRFLVATLVLGLALSLNTGALQAQTATSSNRFLFIIDTSASMKPFEKGVQDSLFDLISTGLRGPMTNGDTYGIWLVNDENDMSFTMEMWRHKFKVEMAARAALHVKERGYRGKLDVNAFMKDALAVTRGVGDLTLIFISNGETPIAQTPFDEFINAKFRELAPVMKRKKATINTVLAAQDGKLVAWAVNSPDFLINVPYVAPKPKPAPIVVKPTPRPTNTPPVIATAAAASPVASAPPKARPNVGPIIITKDLVAQERRQFLAMASTLTNEPGAQATTNPEPSAAAATNTAVTTADNSSSTNATVVLTLTNKVEEKPVAIAAAPTTNPAPTNAVSAITRPEGTNVATVTVSVSMPPSPTPAAVSSAPVSPNSPQAPEVRSESQPLLWVAIGAGAMFVCMLSVLAIVRVRRPEPSLVSQAILREQIKTS